MPEGIIEGIVMGIDIGAAELMVTSWLDTEGKGNITTGAACFTSALEWRRAYACAKWNEHCDIYR
jgi:hypothetical protein